MTLLFPQILNSSKTTADEISQKQLVGMETERQIDKARKEYEPIAEHATTLFFLIGKCN